MHGFGGMAVCDKENYVTSETIVGCKGFRSLAGFNGHWLDVSEGVRGESSFPKLFPTLVSLNHFSFYCLNLLEPSLEEYSCKICR
jgi:hypothetical protein